MISKQSRKMLYQHHVKNANFSTIWQTFRKLSNFSVFIWMFIYKYSYMLYLLAQILWYFHTSWHDFVDTKIPHSSFKWQKHF